MKIYRDIQRYNKVRKKNSKDDMNQKNFEKNHERKFVKENQRIFLQF